MMREIKVSVSDFILPLFVTHGQKVRNPISSMPGQYQLSLDQVLVETTRAKRLGIEAVLLFGIPRKKDTQGSEAYASNGIVQQAVRALRKNQPEMVVMTDLCFCEYTDHGHCGIIKKAKHGGWDVDNDATLELIKKTALAQAKAGVDFVAPSGMMDGAVGTIRQALDENGYGSVGILAYSAKFASVFYGPFREAAQSRPQFGDRRSYQLDPANVRMALRQIRDDVEQGADMVMVKPALSTLDVLVKAKEGLPVPLVAYNVSGEYAMVKAAEKLGWLEGGGVCRAALEILTSIKRAGADLIITYHALEVAEYLKKNPL